jgi:Fe-S oxidoreductase
MLHATAGSFIGIPGVAWFWIITVIAVGAVLFSLFNRFRMLKIMRADNRFDQTMERIKDVLVFAIGQKKMFKDPYAGVFHLLIFYGFLVVSIRTVTMVLEGLFAGWELPLLHTPIGHAYLFSKDVFEVLVLIGIVMAVVRRLLFPPERIVQSFAAWLVLGLISTLMLTDLLSEGARIQAGDITEASYLPMSALFGQMMGGLSATGLQVMYSSTWWIHLVVLYYFANELPYSKHFHVYTSIFNIYFRKRDAAGKLPTMDLENVDDDTRFGTKSVTDFTWKQGLDMYTCTECGRCREYCPTTLTNKPLQPVLFTKAIRDQVYQEQKDLLKQKTDGKVISEIDLVPTVVDPDVVWACTTCRWCEEACPLEITYTDKLIEMRQNLVLEKAEFPEEAQTAFRGMEVNGNPWQIAPESRMDWTEGLDIPVCSDVGQDFDYLFWVGCAGAFDDNAKKVTVATAKLLKAAGVKFAILGVEEMCTGDAARRLGNEYLYQTLAQQNIETLNNYGVKKIIANCPHCFNALGSEYEDLGGKYEAIHGTQFVADLVKEGKIKLTKSVDREIVFHDPCYLGRTNNEFEAPRYLLEQIPGIKLKEAELSREKAMCCGAGGGRMWLEEDLGDRINRTRWNQMKETGCQDAAVACPFCYSMISDGQQEVGDEESKTFDVIQLVAESAEL